MNRLKWMRVLGAAIGMLAIAIVPVLAQAQSGNLYGTVKDSDGQALPGVLVTVTGGGAPLTQVSDAQGQFRFLGLSPGKYQVEGTLDGFSPIVYPNAVINVGRNTTLELTMSAAVTETITITAESPLLDSRKITTGATVSQTELEKIPSARDPWVILQTTPGVLVDRVNVGGNESGQQSTYVGGGDSGFNSTWSVDGVEITDVGAIGSSPGYYDFGAFEELQVTTGGADATQRTGGIGMNMVTKRGTNEWRGSGRYLEDKDSWQSDFSSSSGDFGAAGPWNQGQAQAAFKQGNRIVKVQDYGAELGGPLVKDKLWIWGSYGKQKVDLLTVSDFSDKSDLETWNAKLNWQATSSNAATVFFSNNDKTKIGRNASPTRTQPTTWNQSGMSSDPNFFAFWNERPTVSKIEDTQIFGSNFFLTGLYAESDGGFHLAPQGGLNASMGLNFANLAWTGSFIDYFSLRPEDQYKLDGSYFLTTGNINHELKFGTSYRKATVKSLTTWPGQVREGYLPSAGSYYAYAYAQAVLNYDVKYKNAYVQDTLTTGNMTVNLGLRYDNQDGSLLPGVAKGPSNPAVAAFLPGYTFAGGDPGFDAWTDISPRLGLTYALGDEKKTLLRASYARYVDQLSGFSTFSQAYPLYPAAYVYFYSYDYAGNQNNVTDLPGELGGLVGSSPNWNPNNPAVLAVANGIDPDLTAPYSDEVTLGVEHALLPEFVVGLTATYRKNKDILTYTPLVFDGDPYSLANVGSLGRKATRNDFVVANTYSVTLPDGTVRDVNTYGLRAGVLSRGGTLLENSDRSQTYKSLSATFNKRLSNRWMARGNFTWNDWKWNIPSSAIINPANPVGGGNQDGDRVVTCVGAGSGAKAGVCISSAWSYSLTGMYQVAPEAAWGFNVAAALNGHEGYANPYWIRGRTFGFASGSHTYADVTATNRPDDYSNEDVHVLDLRVEKEFKFDRVGLTLGVDCFNALNAGTVLQRSLKLDYGRGSGSDRTQIGDHVQEVLSPRIFRVGATLSFN